METRTTRQKIVEVLEQYQETPHSLSEYFKDVSEEDILTHLQHIKRSLQEKDKQLVAIPPECKNCSFSDFDYIINDPSRCPNCKSERIEQPVFTIVID